MVISATNMVSKPWLRGRITVSAEATRGESSGGSMAIPGAPSKAPTFETANLDCGSGATSDGLALLRSAGD
jgi:hypothetical protein